MILKANKFIKFQVIAQVDDSDEEGQAVGFSEAQPVKKKKSRKKPNIVVAPAIIPVDTITSIIKGDGGISIVDTLDKTFQVTDDFDMLLKKLRVK